MKELKIVATKDNLPQVLAFIEQELEVSNWPLKKIMRIAIACEEIYINVASYAYAPSVGEVTINCQIDANTAVISFIDQGIAYNPLTAQLPNIKASAEERDIGGLGILMTLELMDKVQYQYEQNRNILTITQYNK